MVSLDGQRVLVVDGHTAYLEIWSELLRTLGAHPTLAGSPREALALLRSTHFALVFVDQNLSDDCTGAEIVRMIREQRTFQLPDMPVVACTSDVTEATRHLLSQAGVDAVLAKPIDVAAVVGMLARMQRSV